MEFTAVDLNNIRAILGRVQYQGIDEAKAAAVIDMKIEKMLEGTQEQVESGDDV